MTFLNKNTWWQQNMFFCWIRFLKKIHSNRFWYIEVNDPNVTICFFYRLNIATNCERIPNSKFAYSTAHCTYLFWPEVLIWQNSRTIWNRNFLSFSVRKCLVLQSFWHNSLTSVEHFGCSFSSLTFSSITSNSLDTDGNSHSLYSLHQSKLFSRNVRFRCTDYPICIHHQHVALLHN